MLTFRLSGVRVPGVIFAGWCILMATWAMAGALVALGMAYRFGWDYLVAAVIGQLAWELVGQLSGRA